MKKESGFTLIELMIAMAIIAILATAGISAYTGYVKKGRDTARAEIAGNLNTAVMSYAASNGGNPPATADAFSSFLSSTSEVFGGGSGGTGLSIQDPVGGKNVCLDAAGNADEPCTFNYTAYDDGTYAISYGVEHESSREQNFYKTTQSVAPLSATSNTSSTSENPVPKYGVYVGSAPFIGSPSTPATTTEQLTSIQGVDETQPVALVPVFRSIKMNAVVSGGDGGGSTPVTCTQACANGHTCINSTCMCGASAACTGYNVCKEGGCVDTVAEALAALDAALIAIEDCLVLYYNNGGPSCYNMPFANTTVFTISTPGSGHLCYMQGGTWCSHFMTWPWMAGGSNMQYYISACKTDVSSGYYNCIMYIRNGGEAGEAYSYSCVSSGEYAGVCAAP